MNKEFVKSATLKLAQQINQQELFDSFRGDKNAFNSYLNYEKEITRARELSKLEAANIVRPKGSYTKPFMIGAGIVTISLLAEQIMDWLKGKISEHKSQEYYQRMLEAHPQLQNEDPAEVAKYWQSLNHFAPHVAEDPLAAGAYITQSIRKLSGEQLGGPPPDTFNTLADIQKKSKEGRPENGTGKDVSGTARTEAVRQIIGQLYH